MNLRTELPTAENSSNFNAVADAATKAGTTLENLKAAVAGETGASAKYAGLRPARTPVGGYLCRRADSHQPRGFPG